MAGNHIKKRGLSFPVCAYQSDVFTAEQAGETSGKDRTVSKTV